VIKLDKISALNRAPGKAGQEAVVAGPARLTWGELEALTRRLVRHFAGKGYRRVLFLSENRPELVALFAAFSTLGVSFTGVDYTATAAQHLHCAGLIGADALVYSAAFAGQAAGLLGRWPMGSFCLDTDLAALPAADGSAAAPPAPACFESIAFTSGTTGFPKAVHRTRSFDARRFADLVGMFGFDDRQVFLATIPFYHVSVVGWARLTLSLGGKLVLAPVEDAAALATAVRRERVTALLATPVVLGDLLDGLRPGGKPADLDFIITGGKHFPQDLKERSLAFFGPVVHEYYGTTETGVNAIAAPADLADHPASSGRLLDGNAVAILGEDGLQVSDGTVGRVAIHSYQNMDGYLNGPAANRVTLGGDTYLVTADFGYLRRGRIFLVNRTFGRATSLDLYGLEDQVRRLPGVRDVFSVSAGRHAVDLFIAPERHLRPDDLAAPLAALAGRWPGVEIRPAFVGRIPYSLSGKVRAGELAGGR
jgi:acyl-CoA synthetase (AMP-forming)/AMP-acid ligase II